MIKLSLDEVKLVVKNRNIKDYENRSEKDLKEIIKQTKTKNKHF